MQEDCNNNYNNHYYKIVYNINILYKQTTIVPVVFDIIIRKRREA